MDATGRTLLEALLVMKILALETATRSVGCALWGDGGPLASFFVVAGPRHAEVLVPALDDLCRQSGLGPGDLDAIAVDVGPGLFTGLRVGLATARAIAMARGLPQVGVTSLEALAYSHRRRPGLLASVVDARRSEVYWALYRSDGGAPEEVRAPAVAAPGALARELAALAEAPLAVGDGAWRYREVLEAAGAEVAGPAGMWPSPLVVAELGARRLGAAAAPSPVSPQSLRSEQSLRPPQPLYLRQADVRIGWDQVGGRVGTGARAGSPDAGARLGQ